MARLGTVILFARVPRLGRGKRRLAADIGDLAALRVYQRALAQTLRVVGRRHGWRALIALEPGTGVRRPGPPFARTRIPRFPQSGRDLGQRMAHGLRQAPPGPVVLIGADIKGVNAAALRRALIACRRADMVFGPALDGGFWLVGCKRAPSPRVFDGLAWSRADTLEQTIARLPKPWRTALVDRLSDIDRAADL